MRSIAAVVLGCLLARAASAQTAAAPHATEPNRPRLARDADTNSATAYIRFGMAALDHDPQAAANAFYWASRLQPDWSQPLYARRIALLIADPDLLKKYFEDDRATLRSPRVQAMDSLLVESFFIEPFFFPYLDELLLQRFAFAEVGGTPGYYWNNLWQTGVQSALGRAGTSLRATVNLSRGDFRAADSLFARLETRDSSSDLPEERATALMLLGRPDSAAIELRRAVALARLADTTRPMYSYDSKEILLYRLGVALEQADDTAGARQAFEQAVVENLGFWPSHIRLATMALAEHDTARARREAEAAVDIRDIDYHAHMLLGLILGASGHFDDAIAHVTRATALEPYAAAAVKLLAKIDEVAGRRADAITAYSRYLALSAQDDPERVAIANHLLVLQRASRPSNP